VGLVQADVVIRRVPHAASPLEETLEESLAYSHGLLAAP
jgi:hypothetical protein